MKKFYTLALATAVALSASAERQQVVAKMPILKADASGMAVKKEMPAQRFKKAPAKAASLEDVAAFDVWTCYQLVGQDAGQAAYALEIAITDASKGEVEITLGGLFVVKGIYDADNATLSIANMQDLGVDKYGDEITFYLKSMTSDGTLVPGASSVTSTVGTLEGNSIDFPDLELWAIGNPDDEESGWWSVTAMNSFTKDPYYSLGTGKYVENIVYPAFMQGAENTEEAEVEVLTDGEGSYIVLDPLKSLYAAKGRGEYESPEMMLDATDPENVLLPMTETGIINSSDLAYLYFGEGWYSSLDPDEIETVDPALCIKKTVEGNKVTFTFPYHCSTLTLEDYSAFYYASAFASTLTFTEDDSNAGIGSVAVEEEGNAPAVYYNLQGVRVENPSNGVVIRVQNGKASKMLVK